MKLPSKFKFNAGGCPLEYTAVRDGGYTTISWGSGVAENSIEYSPAAVEENVADGYWEILPESFDKTDTFNFIEKSMRVGVDMGAVGKDYSPGMFDKTAENTEGVWDDVKEFCKETNAVVTIFPEYFQVATRGEVTRLSTLEELLELIDAVRVLNKYKLV